MSNTYPSIGAANPAQEPIDIVLNSPAPRSLQIFAGLLGVMVGIEFAVALIVL